MRSAGTALAGQTGPAAGEDLRHRAGAPRGRAAPGLWRESRLHVVEGPRFQLAAKSLWIPRTHVAEGVQ